MGDDRDLSNAKNEVKINQKFIFFLKRKFAYKFPDEVRQNIQV